MRISCLSGVEPQRGVLYGGERLAAARAGTDGTTASTILKQNPFKIKVNTRVTRAKYHALEAISCPSGGPAFEFTPATFTLYYIGNLVFKIGLLLF